MLNVIVAIMLLFYFSKKNIKKRYTSRILSDFGYKTIKSTFFILGITHKISDYLCLYRTLIRFTYFSTYN